MLSSICVATTTGFPASRHLATTVFCHVAICASGTSTPKIAASDHDPVALLDDVVDVL